MFLLKTPPKYRKLDQTKTKNPPKITRLLTIFAEHGIITHNPLMAKPMKNPRIALSNNTAFDNYMYIIKLKRL